MINDMKNLQYWLRTEEVNGGIEYTLIITQIHQCRPFNCEEISEHEYNVWKERLNRRADND